MAVDHDQCDQEHLALGVTMTPDKVNDMIDERLLRLGVDTSNVLDAQKDFHYLRYIRSGSTAIKTKIVMSAVGFVSLGGAGALWAWFSA